MGGGAWPFLVGGAICLVNSDNERDSSLLTSRRVVYTGLDLGAGGSSCFLDLCVGNVFLEGLAASSRKRLSNNRSVMPLDVLGRTRATLKGSACPSLSERSGKPVETPS